jgi:hypothetical protein
MAKIVEELVVVKVSQLVKDGSEGDSKVNDELVTALEQVVSELVGEGAVVEVIKG